MGETNPLVTSAAPLGPSGRPERAAALARGWLDRAALRRLVTLFGSDPDHLARAVDGADEDWLHLHEELPNWLVRLLDDPGHRDEPALLDVRHSLVLERWAADRFNFRSRDGSTYRERNQLSSGGFDDEAARGIHEAASELGLTGSTRPRLDQYDATLVLGGGWRSPLLRARYAAQWQRDGVDLGTAYFLGSPRFLMAEPGEQAESDGTRDYAPGATDEFDLLVAAAAQEFAVAPEPPVLLCGCSDITRICPTWRHQDTPEAADTPPQYTHERTAALLGSGAPGTVLSAATGRPPYRPDTTDTLALWARVASPTAGQRVLVVTTQVFVPFQTFDSVKRLYLPHGVDLDVVGYSAEWGDRPETPEYLLQETLSAIRSARRLLVDAAATATGHAG